MTSLPPKYESAAEEEEGLLSETTYPPDLQATTSRAVAAPTETDGISTTMCFRPSYPLDLTAENANAMAPLPRSREEAVQLAIEAFPVLQDYAEDRIRFYVGSAAVLRSAWGSLRTSPPQNITVHVSDGPGDLQKRQRHKRNNTIRRTAIYFAVVGSVVAPIVWLSNR